MNRYLLAFLVIAAAVGVFFMANHYAYHPGPMPPIKEAIQWQQPTQPGVPPIPLPTIKYMFTNPVVLPFTLLAVAAFLVRLGIGLIGGRRRFS